MLKEGGHSLSMVASFVIDYEQLYLPVRQSDSPYYVGPIRESSVLINCFSFGHKSLTYSGYVNPKLSLFIQLWDDVRGK